MKSLTDRIVQRFLCVKEFIGDEAGYVPPCPEQCEECKGLEELEAAWLKKHTSIFKEEPA